MNTFFYRFASEAEAISAFEPITVYPPYELDNIAVDVIGIIYKATGNMIPHPIFGQIPEMAESYGWHINTTEQLAGFEEWEVFPVTPYRVFM